MTLTLSMASIKLWLQMLRFANHDLSTERKQKALMQ